jgi:hypothetical protein
MYNVKKFGFVLEASSQEEKKLLLKIQKLGYFYVFSSIDDFLKMNKPHIHKSDAIKECLKFKKKNKDEIN